jgi:hypothetical protein
VPNNEASASFGGLVVYPADEVEFFSPKIRCLLYANPATLLPNEQPIGV